MKNSILIIDDELSMCTLLSLALGQEYDVHYATTAQEGIKYVKEKKVDLILLDLMIGSSDGIDVLKQIKKENGSVSVIMMTAYGSIPTSVEAIQNGAFTYLVKPLDIDELNVFIKQALDVKHLNDQCEYLTEELKGYYGYHKIIGKSPAIQKVFDMIERLKDVDTSVMIYGESGTGKELAAQALHQLGRRAKNRFVAINCAAIPESLLEEEMFGHKRGSFTGAVQDKKGKFEVADKGTIFLDEIGDMPLGLQGKLLRVLQQKEFSPLGSNEVRKLDVRIVAATNRDLESMVHAGTFREDLYYRLNVISITMPPLRERREDIPLLGSHFLRQFEKEQNREKLTLSPEAESLLMEYDFPGNVRQLSNILEYAVILSHSGRIEAEDLPDAVRKGKTAAAAVNLPGSRLAGMTIREVEEIMIREALKRNNGRREQTAQELGISMRGLFNKIKEYDI